MPTKERLTPAYRYQHDPRFKGLCNMLEGFLATTEFTPTEVREAAMVAIANHEARNQRPRMFVVTGIAVVPGHSVEEPPPLVCLDGVYYERVADKPLIPPKPSGGQ